MHVSATRTCLSGRVCCSVFSSSWSCQRTVDSIVVLWHRPWTRAGCDKLRAAPRKSHNIRIGLFSLWSVQALAYEQLQSGCEVCIAVQEAAAAGLGGSPCLPAILQWASTF